MATSEAFAVTHNNLTMAGGDFSFLDIAIMWEREAYVELLGVTDDDLAELQSLFEYVPTLDELAAAHGEPDDADNWPMIRVKVDPLAYNPEGNKVARTSALAPIVEAGNVWLPHPRVAPWVWDFIAEFSQFPYAAYDERVDALGQLVQGALDRMGKKKVRART